MAKILFLLLACCALIPGALWAQTYSRDIPQKLQLKKADLTGIAQPDYFAKTKTTTGSDNVKSLVFLGPPKRDTVHLLLPAMKNTNVGFEIKTGPREPLFRRQ